MHQVQLIQQYSADITLHHLTLRPPTFHLLMLSCLLTVSSRSTSIDPATPRSGNHTPRSYQQINTGEGSSQSTSGGVDPPDINNDIEEEKIRHSELDDEAGYAKTF